MGTSETSLSTYAVKAPRLVIDALPARFGGTAYAAVQTAKQLAQCESFSEVVVVTRERSIVATGLQSTGRLRLVSLPSSSRGELARRLAWEAIALPRQIARRAPTLMMTWSGMLPRKLRAPVTCLLSNPLMFEHHGLANRLRRKAVHRTVRGAAGVVVPTQAMARLASGALGIPVTIIPWGVDHARFSPANEQGDEILYVADFYRHKRHDIVLDAWAALAPPRPTLRLIGDPTVPRSIYRQVLNRINGYQSLGLIEVDHHVRLGELVAAYRRARVFVLPSEYESFCIPLLEALACGVPAVARDLPALRETGGLGAAYVDGNEPARWSAELQSLLTDDRAHGRARAFGLAHASKFSWRRTASGLRDQLLIESPR